MEEGDSWYEEEGKERIPEQVRIKSRREMRKPAETVRCTLLNGSAWSTKKKRTCRRSTGTFDFFGVERRMGWRTVQQRGTARMEVRCQTVRIIDVSGSSEDCKHWSVLWQNTPIGNGERERRKSRQAKPRERRTNRPSMGERQRRYAGLGSAILALRRTPRNEALMEAVVKQARTTRHPLLVASDQEDPAFFRIIVVRKNVCRSMCGSKDPKGELIERTAKACKAKRQ